MRQFGRIFYCLAWFDNVEFNRLRCPISKIYDDAVFADRFRYQLTMFGIRVLIGLSRLFHTHTACEIDTAKITAAIFRISYRLHDLIRLNLIVCHVQITNVRWCGFRRSIPLSIDYVWNCIIDRAISTPSCSYCIWNRYCQNRCSIVLNFVLFEWFDTLELNR